MERDDTTTTTSQSGKRMESGGPLAGKRWAPHPVFVCDNDGEGEGELEGDCEVGLLGYRDLDGDDGGWSKMERLGFVGLERYE